MTKKHEGLVEEMADHLQAAYAMGQHDYKLGVGYGATPRKWHEDQAKKLISRIGKAYADGMPLPGEVGRIPADMLGGGKGEVVHVREGDTIIILRQGGTGKEEEE